MKYHIHRATPYKCQHSYSAKALRYHVSVHPLAQRLTRQIQGQELLQPGDRVGVAVSGGIDSVALLRLLLELRSELGIVLSVVHFNHKLRGAESDADEEFVAQLAREHKLEFYCDSGDAAELAAEEHRGMEAAARGLRYGFFESLLSSVEELPRLPRPGRRGAPQEVNLPTLSQSARQGWGNPELNSTLGIRALSNLDKIATGHTLDDQAETVLMRIIRGTGTGGLGGIFPRVVVEGDDGEVAGEIIRPMLGIRRRELQQYLNDLKQPWREDASNSDSKFTRNRVRKLLLPLIEREFNPSIATNLSELATIARDEEDYWENEISGWQGTVLQWSQPEWMRQAEEAGGLVQIGLAGQHASEQSRTKHEGARQKEMDAEERARPFASANCSVSRPWLVTEPKAVQRRVIKAVGEQAGIPLEFRHVEEILHFADEDGPAGKELALPLGWKLVREAEAIVFVTPDLRHRQHIADYDYRLEIPGRVSVPEIGVVIEALIVRADSLESSDLPTTGAKEGVADSRATQDLQSPEYNPQQLLDAKLMRSPLTVRNWRAGDRYWPAHTKAPKKIKELLQEQHVGLPERKLWPVVISGEEIIWMRGFPVPASWAAKARGQAVLIREVVDDAR